MEPMDAIRVMADDAGLSLTELSRKTGRARTYLHAAISNGSSPQMNTFMEFAEACGYRLEAVGHGKRIALGPEGGAQRDG